MLGFGCDIPSGPPLLPPPLLVVAKSPDSSPSSAVIVVNHAFQRTIDVCILKNLMDELSITKSWYIPMYRYVCTFYTR